MTATQYSLSTRLNLANGLTIPQIHLGVYLMSGREAKQAVGWALADGYRAVDSAQMYHNERECGQAIRDFINDKTRNRDGLRREDIFYTSKLATNSTYERARQSIRRSVETSGLGYIDLFLLHSPLGGKTARLESWKALEDAVIDGEVKIPGVSNYGVRHMEELINSKPRMFPLINQVEVHPFNTRTAITSFCKKNGILVEAYAPLARAMRMQDPTVVNLAEKYKCTPAQLMIRWSLQHGYIPLPKSATKQRIEANGKISSFAIDEQDMKAMDGLHEGLVTDWEVTDAD